MVPETHPILHTAAINAGPEGRQAPSQIANVQVGFERDDWAVNLFLNNAFDERAELFVNPRAFAYAV